MNAGPPWLTRLFHEPRDLEVEDIRRDLKVEERRHVSEIGKIHDALAGLGAEYERAEQERRDA